MHYVWVQPQHLTENFHIRFFYFMWGLGKTIHSMTECFPANDKSLYWCKQVSLVVYFGLVKYTRKIDHHVNIYVKSFRVWNQARRVWYNKTCEGNHFIVWHHTIRVFYHKRLSYHHIQISVAWNHWHSSTWPRSSLLRILRQDHISLGHTYSR